MPKHYGNDERTYRNSHKNQCRRKSYILELGITEKRLPQIGCGLGKHKWKKIMADKIHVFKNSRICVIFIRLCQSNPLNESLIMPEEQFNDAEMNRKVFHKCTVCKFVFEYYCTVVPFDNPNRSDTQNSERSPGD